jgi:hypothetical protein
MKYRKKPVIIDAVQWFKVGDHSVVIPFYDTGLLHPCQGCGEPMSLHGRCPTLEGHHLVCPGDWIITGIKGEHYPCKPDIFEATYEKVEE